MLAIMKFGQRLEEALQEMGWGQRELGEMSGVDGPTISALIRRRSDRSNYKEQLISAFPPSRISHAWLRDGAGVMKPVSTTNTKVHHNVEEGPDIQGLVPLISSVQAGEWCEIMDTFQPGEAEAWFPCPVKHGPNCFALRVRGDSMRNPETRPSYDPGDIIFVDPAKTPVSGDRVVVRLDDEKEATFKQYIEEDGRKMLKALNPEWRPRYVEINGDASICGVVIGKWVPE